MSTVSSFRGAYAFLSNFYNSPFWVEELGAKVPTLEHAFQALKTLDPKWRHAIRLADTPAQAKALGRAAPRQPNWDNIRVDVMQSLLALKFAEGSEMARLLQDTGSAELVEGNTWGDQFWGVCRGKGENWLGRLLMKRRSALGSTIHTLKHKRTITAG